MAGRYDLEIEQGATFRREIAYRDATGALVDLTGYSARAHVRGDVVDASPVLEMTTANGRIALGSFGSGDWIWNVTVLVAATTTAALADWGEGVWDLELVSAGGVVTRLLQGQAVLSLEVTR